MANIKRKRKDYSVTIEIPTGIGLSVSNNEITMKKGNKILSKNLNPCITLKQEGQNIILSVKKARREEKREFGTLKGHIRNMIEGLEKEYEYELEVCNVHFPMTLTFDKTKSEFIVKNLLGEKSPRILKAGKNIEVEIKMPHIKIKSYDLELAGQTAANLEKLTKIRNRDRNKFQDGIFITKKPGKIYL